VGLLTVKAAAVQCQQLKFTLSVYVKFF